MNIKLAKLEKLDDLDKDTMPFDGPFQPVAESSEDTVLADLDGDGDLDLVTRYRAALQWHQNTKGTFRASTIVDGVNYAAFAVGDLDRDGDLDIATTKGVWLNDGKGAKWSRQKGIDDGESGTGVIAIGDVDGDGDADVVSGAKPFGWWENADGKGGAWGAKREIIANHFVETLALLDVDGDGDVDIMSGDRSESNSDKHELRWHENAGGKFTTHVLATGAGFVPWSLQAIDWDDDRDLDILLGGAIKLAILENLGKGRFGTVLLRDAESYVMAHQVRAADIDGDDDADLVVTTNFSSPSIMWVERRGDEYVEHLVRANKPPGTPEYVPLAVGDLDGDGDPDLVVTDDENVGILRNNRKR
jgi:hypothetical protein